MSISMYIDHKMLKLRKRLRIEVVSWNEKYKEWRLFIIHTSFIKFASIIKTQKKAIKTQETKEKVNKADIG